MPDAVLFDLDGTFADTAPDLGAALNHLRADLDLEPVSMEKLRPFVSQGVRGMLRAGLDMLPDHPDYTDYYQRFLTHYQQALCTHTVVFPGIDALVQTLEAEGIAWGIITNKSQRFTLPLMDALGYARRAACIVSGDSSPRAKPYAHPMHLACSLAGCRATASIYVGDDLRDIQAGKAAGMTTIAAAYGYLGDSGPIDQWGATHRVEHAKDIFDIVSGY
ncbi:MAG: HAD-IA family hydrolase [Zoogloeaceae bacterium]|nr:HAD-IA family hydrolase [Zoogloeaceae bacterium]